VVLIENVPSDKVNLRLLRVNGNRSDILVNAKDTFATVKQQIFNSWPKGIVYNIYHIIIYFN